MKAYLITTETTFGLITLVYVWRVVAEGFHAGVFQPRRREFKVEIAEPDEIASDRW